MKKYICMIWAVLTAMSSDANLILSNPAGVPTTNVVVVQSNFVAGNNVQVSHSATKWQGVGQSFLWTTNTALDTVGIYLANTQTAFTRNQQYVLVVQALSGLKGTATSVVTQVEFTMEASKIAANQWLQLDIDNLALQEGQYYGFTLCPTATDIGGMILFAGSSSVNSDYVPGEDIVFDPGVEGLPFAGSYDDNVNKDLTFYLQTATIPEPSTLNLVIISTGVLLGIRRLF